jgi:CDP-paratose 2-epimerase
MNFTYSNNSRIGDHIWYISDVSKFKKHFPEWEYQYGMQDIMAQIFESMHSRVSTQIA